MSSVYKQFTAQDFATVPFNAHKQYNFGSASAAENQITYYSTRWTSESISLYSSASTNPFSLFDPINTIKYNQIDYLFYKNFKTDAANRGGKYDFRKQKRELYEKANILSIPTGLYGHEIKPGTFYMSSSYKKIVDDSYGNLIVSGTNVDNYPTDINRNTFRLDPRDGFRKYDLGIYEGYAVDYGDVTVPMDYEGNPVPGATPRRFKKFFRKGTKDPNAPKTFINNNSFIYDDSYYNNHLKFSNVTFRTSSLGHPSNRFPIINFNSITGSYVVSPTKPAYNFNRDDDFAISFWIEPKPHTDTFDDEESPYPNIGDALGGGFVFNVDEANNIAYVLNPGIFKTNSSFADWTPGDSMNLNSITIDETIGGGEANTEALANFNYNGGNFLVAQEVSNTISQGYDDWWMANVAETKEIFKTLGVDDPNPEFRSLFNTPYINLGDFDDYVDNGGATPPLPGGGFQFPSIVTSNINTLLGFETRMLPTMRKLSADGTCNGLENSTCADPSGCCTDEESTSISAFPQTILMPIGADWNSQLQAAGYVVYNNYTLLVRKVNLETAGVGDASKRYIIAKSGTKTVVPTPMMGTSEPYTTATSGNLQPQNVAAESQFPYEIYLQSSSLCFDRSDGSNIASLCCGVTGSDGTVVKSSHIVCQNSASHMQIWYDGEKVAELDSNENPLQGTKTQNNANLYIGSRGRTSQNDGLGEETEYITNNRFFNGNIGYINIFDHYLESSSIVPMSESVNNSPYIGNIFYQNGLATITHPNHYDILATSEPYGIGDLIIGEDGTFIVSGDGGINNIKFQGSHLMYEHEYQCTVDEHEFNATTNISARKNLTRDNYQLADFATGSLFRPYVTTIGLYNKDNDLLVVGKLGQPIRMSNETDTTFIMRWDT